MTFLRNFTLVLFLAITAHTLYTGIVYGWNFVSVFLAVLFSLTWQGQFALDFLCYLMLSGLWVAWRGGFTGASIALGLLASVMGMLVFAVLILIFIRQSSGDMRKLLLGVHGDPDKPS
ncbi:MULTISPECIES: hypothetical protein [unclassified Roseovarius]|uniref:hypothetical protein n=1 Tax=unclassified Roseovarius TaxID=2614913 RepID=UPI00273D7221|nr:MULTISPECIES: hypothetical protein [unclassified Roseovarius]